MTYLLIPSGCSGRNTVYNTHDQPRRAGGFTCMSLCALDTILRYLRLYLAVLFLSSTTFTRQLPRSLSRLTAGKYFVNVVWFADLQKVSVGFRLYEERYMDEPFPPAILRLITSCALPLRDPPGLTLSIPNPQVIHRDTNGLPKALTMFSRSTF